MQYACLCREDVVANDATATNDAKAAHDDAAAADDDAAAGLGAEPLLPPSPFRRRCSKVQQAQVAVGAAHSSEPNKSMGPLSSQP
mmetsp:Transcript_2437/g.6172  ORF Transcript_2437/g.6172 Transcript_2437/m.6172 type:complete len:85 (+) Transcript_2437:58-312(+)